MESIIASETREWVRCNLGLIHNAVDQEMRQMMAAGIDPSKGNLCAGLFKYLDRSSLPSNGKLRFVRVDTPQTKGILHAIIEIETIIIDPTYMQFGVHVEEEDLVDSCLVGPKEYLYQKYGIDYAV